MVRLPPSRKRYGGQESRTLRLIFPDSHKVDDHLDGLLHVLDRNPFEPRVKILLARKDVWRREAHERKAAAVGAAANWPLTYVEAASTNGLSRIFHDLRKRLEDFLHIAIRLFDVRLDGRARDRKSTRLNSSHSSISYAVLCLKKKK